MSLKYQIVPFFMLLSFGAIAQTDTSSFQHRKPLSDFAYQRPVFKLQGEQLGNQNRLLRFFTVTGYREGVKSIDGGWGVNFNAYNDEALGIQLVTAYNQSIAELLYHFPVDPHLLVLEVKDPSKYAYDPKYGDKESWMRKNAWCYELALPLGSLTGVKMIDGYLAQAFGVKFTNEKRLVKALVLFRTSTVDKLKSAGKGEGKYDMQGHFNNIPVDRLSDPLGKAGFPPMVNETGYTSPVDMDLHISSWTDLAAVRKELNRYDLDLKEGMREVEVFVITEIDPKK